MIILQFGILKKYAILAFRQVQEIVEEAEPVILYYTICFVFSNVREKWIRMGLACTLLLTMAQKSGRYRIFLCKHSIAKVQKKYIKPKLGWKYLLINKDQVRILSFNSLLSSFELSLAFLSEEAEVPWKRNSSESCGGPVVLHNSSLRTNDFEDNF